MALRLAIAGALVVAACGPVVRAKPPAAPEGDRTVAGAPRAGKAPADPDALKKAREHVRAGRFADALDVLRAGDAKDPDVLAETARVLARLNQVEPSLAFAGAAIRAGLKSADGWLTIALAVYELGEADDAASLLRDAPKGDERMALLDVDLARANGDYAAAHRMLEELLAKDPKDTGAWAALSRVMLAEGKAGAARYVAERALSDGLDSAELHAARGQAALAEGDPEAAARHLARALELDPLDGASASALGMLRLEHGDAAGALAPLERATALHLRDKETRIALAAARRLARDANGAASSLEQVLVLDPYDLRALTELARLYDEDLEQPELARQIRERMDMIKNRGKP